jgi:hypothetical protein
VTRAGGAFRRCGRSIALVVAAAAVVACRAPAGRETPDAVAASPAESPSPGDAPFPVHGSISSRARARFTAGSEDVDLYALVAVDAGDAARHPVTAHALARLSADLDGASEDSPFGEISDTFDGDVNGRVYSAYLDFEGLRDADVARVGRQATEGTPVFARFDGVRVETTGMGKGRVVVGAYGGVPVHLYETVSDGDRIGGVSVEGRPWAGSRVRGDYMRIEDETLAGGREDDLFGVSAWQAVGESATVSASHTRLGGRARDVAARAAFRAEALDLDVAVSYYELLATQRELSTELDPFVASLRDLFPFRQAGLLVSKGISSHLRLDGGLDVRRVDDADDEGEFNRDYGRAFATAIFPDALGAGITPSVTADSWASGGRSVHSWGADVTKEWESGMRGSLGTSYDLYKLDLATGSERDDVRTLYLRLRYPPSDSVTLDLRYEVEHDDVDLYHLLLLGATWRF